MTETTVIVRVDDGLKTAFTKAAKAADRTTSQLLRDFMRDYIRRRADQAEYDAWFRQRVNAGRKDVREGRVRSSQEVENYFAERRKRSLAKGR